MCKNQGLSSWIQESVLWILLLFKRHYAPLDEILDISGKSLEETEGRVIALLMCHDSLNLSQPDQIKGIKSNLIDLQI